MHRNVKNNICGFRWASECWIYFWPVWRPKPKPALTNQISQSTPEPEMVHRTTVSFINYFKSNINKQDTPCIKIHKTASEVLLYFQTCDPGQLLPAAFSLYTEQDCPARELQHQLFQQMPSNYICLCSSGKHHLHPWKLWLLSIGSKRRSSVSGIEPRCPQRRWMSHKDVGRWHARPLFVSYRLCWSLLTL